MTRQSLTPQSGDIIFTYDHGGNAKGSVAIQRWIDRRARWKLDYFDHVAIVFDNSVALEAVPTSEAGMKGLWSGFPYSGGVQLVVLEDILVRAIENGARLNVLRAPFDVITGPKKLDVMSPTILSILDSAYSVKPLQDAASKILGQPLTEFVASCFDLTAPARDVSTWVDLDDHLRDQLKTQCLYEYPYVGQQFFCSQLAIRVLENAQLIPKTDDRFMTPTGLHQHLSDLKWCDVTGSSYGAENIKALSDSSRSRAIGSYIGLLVAAVREKGALVKAELGVPASLLRQQLDDQLHALTIEMDHLTPADLENDPLRVELCFRALKIIMDGYARLSDISSLS